MKPGPELDALVAEHVIEFAGIDYSSDKGGWQIPPYSTNIASAWEVVEKMEKGVPLKMLMRLQSYKREGVEGFICEFNFPNGFSANGESAPHAICLASLKAIGVEIE